MNLPSYFERIGFDREPGADLDTLRGLLRAHVLSVPFENLDVQLGRPVTTAVEDAYEKIVVARRGGWCYEQNGLFGWVLSQIGFEVTRVAAAVMRAERGEDSAANHLALLVRTADTDDTWLADVGFGGSLLEPIRLGEAEHLHQPFRLGLRRLDRGDWQFWEDAGDGEFSYDFRPEPASEDALARRCEILQSDPDSGFVLNLVAQKRAPGQHTTLRGRRLTRRNPRGAITTALASADELLRVLADVFGLDEPAIAECWAKIAARDTQLFGAE